VCYDSARASRSSDATGGCPTEWRVGGRTALLISLVVLGILASLDPLRPVVFVMVLRTDRINAVAFLAGWGLALSALFSVVFVIFGGDIAGVPRSDQRTWAAVLELVLGALLLVLAARRWQRRGDDARRGTPKLIADRLDHLGPRAAGVVGVLIQPRMLTIAAAVVVAREAPGIVSLLIGFAVFAVVSTAALLGILVYDIRRPDSAQHRLTALVSALERQSPTIVTALFALAGCYLVVDAVRGLVTG
jgi:Sap, sulfolipid-1-addressing protein